MTARVGISLPSLEHDHVEACLGSQTHDLAGGVQPRPESHAPGRRRAR